MTFYTFSHETAPYCKQLYLDVTNTNNGKITWKILKPIIQGKILFGPDNDETKGIVSMANATFEDMRRLRMFFGAIATSIKMLKSDKEFRSNFDNLLNLAKSPFVQAILGGSVDIESIEMVLESIINDTRVIEAVETVGHIFDCFSADRFIAVKDEKELEDVAHELSKKKLFYAGLFFTNDGKTNETSYKLRMEVDNTPVTIENKNRFWFPGPESSFELEMRYHRGFVEIQNSVDMAIIKYKKKQQIDSMNSYNEDLDFSDLSFDDDKKVEKPKDTSYETDDDFDGLKLNSDGDIDEDQLNSTTAAPDVNLADFFKTFQDKINISDSDVDKFADDSDFWSSFDDEEDHPGTTSTTERPDEETTTVTTTRRKRQLDSILGLLGIGSSSNKLQQKPVKYEVDDMKMFTKQFPYPK